jgi:shikimate dehydrogenase
MTPAPEHAPVFAPEGHIRLGLIGDNITRSRSPDLHRIAGELSGLDVGYELFIPRDMGQDFDAVFETCRTGGVRGVNVTYPYKERVVEKVEVGDPLISAMGSVNTVVFESGRAFGHNTDYSGFVAAYRERFGEAAPGRVVMFGAGGVGKAVAFGLVALGAEALVIVDHDAEKAQRLAEALRAGQADMAVSVEADGSAALRGATGVINCTPLGMVGYPGSAVPTEALPGLTWAFDAVYTPVDTRFTRDAEAAGLSVLSGYELFFHQGVQAFRIFTGLVPVDMEELRRRLAAASVG